MTVVQCSGCTPIALVLFYGRKDVNALAINSRSIEERCPRDVTIVVQISSMRLSRRLARCQPTVTKKHPALEINQAKRFFLRPYTVSTMLIILSVPWKQPICNSPDHGDA